MAMPELLFNRAIPPEASIYRVRRVAPETLKLSGYLTHGVYPDGQDCIEWEIKDFDGKEMAAWWGEGRYAMELYSVDPDNRRVTLGRSRYFDVNAQGEFTVRDPIKPPAPASVPQRAAPNLAAETGAPAAPTSPFAALPIPASVPPDQLAAIQTMQYLMSLADKRAQSFIEAERLQMERQRDAERAQMQRIADADAARAARAAEHDRQFFQAMFELQAKHTKPAGPNAAEMREMIREAVEAALPEDDDDDNKSANANAVTGDAAVVAKSMESIAGMIVPMVSKYLNGNGASSPLARGNRGQEGQE